MRRTGLLLVVGVLVAASMPALAGDKDKHKGRKDEKSGGPSVAVSVAFSSEQRRAVEAWFVETHGRGGCPPGLAKKDNGCLPPGQAKKRYAVGRPLPRDLDTHAPSAEIRARIGEPPEGYLYVMVDGDLLKLAAGTRLVVDAIDGLVH
jgi:hypothetical protein